MSKAGVTDGFLLNLYDLLYTRDIYKKLLILAISATLASTFHIL